MRKVSYWEQKEGMRFRTMGAGRIYTIKKLTKQKAVLKRDDREKPITVSREKLVDLIKEVVQ